MKFTTIKDTIKNLELVKQQLINEWEKESIRRCLMWISNQANINLELRKTTNTRETNIREWTIKVVGNYGVLTNNFDNSAAVEFGIGTRGSESPHIEASKNNWIYNLKRISTGYAGKSFLWDAVDSFVIGKVGESIIKQVFDEILGGIL